MLIFFYSENLQSLLNSLVGIINLWYQHFENLLILKTTTKTNLELVTLIKVPENLIMRKLKPQANKLALTKIIYSLEYLTNLDFNVRKGSFNLKYYLEKFILEF